MKLTCCRHTALLILRGIRAGSITCTMPPRRTNIIVPDPSPNRRWTKKVLDLSHIGLHVPEGIETTFDIGIPERRFRPRAKQIRSILYGSGKRLPERSFIEISPGLAISSPELLFVEMSSELNVAEHLMLGYELCGSFSRDPFDPLNGTVTLKSRPLTSVEKIRTFLENIRWTPKIDQARYVIELLSDNAWSPTEAVVATLASLPPEEFGYGLGPVLLNERIDTPSSLARVTEKRWRTPDILFPGTPVGINYDGAVHLDLGSIVRTAMELGRHPEEPTSQFELDDVVRKVRAKAVDDIRRNRELAASGYIVFPVTKEDLYEEGGLDRVMLQVFETVKNFGDKDMSLNRGLVNAEFTRASRQELIWSLLPGKHPQRATRRPAPGSSPYITEVSIGF